MSDVPFFRTAYDGLNVHYSDLTAVDMSSEKSMTHQSFADECDVNNIVHNLDISGFLESSRGRPPQFLDCSQVSDYHSALNTVRYAQSVFMDLPAEVRSRFRNDPGEFVSFFNDPANQDEAIALGLATRSEASMERVQHAGAMEASAPPVKGGKRASARNIPSSDEGGNEGGN